MPRQKPTERMAQLRDEWAKLSHEEKMAVTEKEVTQIEEVRETKSLSSHNTQISSFHDAQAVLGSISRQVCLSYHVLLYSHLTISIAL